MNRSGLLVGLVYLVLMIGDSAGSGQLQHARTLSDSTPAITTSMPQMLATSRMNDEKQIKIQRSFSFDSSQAEFQITNKSTEPVYYVSCDWNKIASYKIKRDDRIRDAGLCWCANGMKLLALFPGGSIRVSIDFSDLIFFLDQLSLSTSKSESLERNGSNQSDGKIKIGFDFQIGKEHHEQTFWSDEIVIPTARSPFYHGRL